MFFPNGLLLCFFFVLVLILSSPNVSVSADDQWTWIIGKWTGTVFADKENLRSLELFSRNGVVIGMYGIAGGIMKEISVQIAGDKIEFDTPANSRVILNKVHATRMDGTFTPTSGKTLDVRLWKDTHKTPAGIAGRWEGRWGGGSNPATCQLVVEFADDTNASIFYAWSEWTDPSGNTRKPGWYRKDAKVDGNKISFKSRTATFSFKIRDNGDRVEGENDDENSITMFRKSP